MTTYGISEREIKFLIEVSYTVELLYPQEAECLRRYRSFMYWFHNSTDIDFLEELLPPNTDFGRKELAHNRNLVFFPIEPDNAFFIFIDKKNFLQATRKVWKGWHRKKSVHRHK